MTDTVFQNLGGEFYLGKRMNKFEHEGMGTCARIEISEDADNANQKVKWFLKVHKTYKLLWTAFFNYLFSPSFYSRSHYTDL